VACSEKQATYTTLAALCITDRCDVQHRPQPIPTHMDFSLQPYSHM